MLSLVALIDLVNVGGNGPRLSQLELRCEGGLLRVDLRSSSNSGLPLDLPVQFSEKTLITAALVSLQAIAVEEGAGSVGLQQEISDLSGEQPWVHFLPRLAHFLELPALLVEQAPLQFQILIPEFSDKVLEVLVVLADLRELPEQFFKLGLGVPEPGDHLLEHVLGASGVELVHLLLLGNAPELGPCVFELVQVFDLGERGVRCSG